MNPVRLFFQKMFKRTKYLKAQRKFNCGKRTYVGEGTKMASNVVVGKFCSISDGCCIGISKNRTELLSTHPFQWCESNERLYGDLKVPKENVVKLEPSEGVVIGNDVTIGYGTIVLGGVSIGDGVQIGAGSIVTKSIPPYAVAVGSPAKILRYRFDESTIKELLELKWWDYPEDFIVTLPFKNIPKCIELLKRNIHLKDSITK